MTRRIQHDLVQGSPEWLQFRLDHHGASEAAAMLGLSLTMKRSELLRMKHTGLPREFSEWVQAHVLDHGHAIEAMARPITEEQLGVDLYQVVYSLGQLSASCDGLDLDGDIAWEHKQWSESLAARVQAGDEMPEEHMPQCQQVMLVTGSNRCLFEVSDGTIERKVSIWVKADPAWHQRLIDGWAQFDIDLANYEPVVVDPIEIVGRRPDQLPALRSSVRGELVLESNIKEWETAALSYIKSVRDHELETDEDFANADEAAKWCDASKLTLLGVRANLMGATGDVNAAVAALDRIAGELDKTRIAFKNAIKTRKEARKEEMVRAAGQAMIAHVAALNAELAPMRLQPVAADFAGAIKGLRSIASMQDALDTTLAGGKIVADAQARGIRANVASFAKSADGLQFLFADLHLLVHKAADDFAAVLDQRISKHRADEAAREAKRQADEAARIAAAVAGEAEKARRAAEAEAQRIAAAEQRAREQEAARIEAEEASAAEAARQREQDAVATVLPQLAPLMQDACQPLSQALASKPDAPMHAREAAALIKSQQPATASEPATLTLGTICARNGFFASEEFLLAKLHIQPARTERDGPYFNESQYQAICSQLQAHVGAMAKLYAGKAA